MYIYMPRIPEAAYATIACARIGAVHSVVFGGFSVESLKDRILDSKLRNQTLLPTKVLEVEKNSFKSKTCRRSY